MPMTPKYYADVEGKPRFKAKTLEEIAAYVSGCFSFNPVPLWAWRNDGEKGIFRCAYGFSSADIGRLEDPTEEGDITNQDRADRIDKTIAFYVLSVKGDICTGDGDLQDLLTDIMYYCDIEGDDFNAIVKDAARVYQLERNS